MHLKDDKLMLRNFIAVLLLFLPLLTLAGGKKIFFPAASFYFWILIAVIFYVFYLFRNSKFPKEFFKSPFVITTIVAASILFLSFISINLFIKDPSNKKKEVVYQPTIKELLETDRENAMVAEAQFTNVDVHINYINYHFDIPASWEGTYEREQRDDFTIYNFYSFKLDLADSDYLDMARFAIALFNIKQDKYDQAKLFLGDISNSHFPYLNYYMAQVNYKLHNEEEAINQYKQAIRVHDRYTQNAYMELVTLLQDIGDDKELTLLLYQPEGRKYIPEKLAIRLFFKDNNVMAYYKSMLSRLFRDFKWTGFIAALAIMLVWLSYIVRIDIFDKEGYFPVAIILFTGMISSFLCFYLYDFMEYNYQFSLPGGRLHQLIYSIFGIGLIEECVKILPLLLLLLFTRNIVNEAYDYILYACVSALGFAFMENLLYFDGDLAGIIHGRAMTAVPGHMMDSSIVAYGFVLSRFRYKNFPLYLAFPIFLLLTCVSHGLYDYWLFISATPIFWLHFLISASLWIIIINNCMNNSPVFSYNMKLQTRNMQIYMAFSLIGILIMEYAIVAWEQGPSYANKTFNSTLILGGIFITYYVDKLTNMDLVKGYWNTITFTTIEDKRRGEVFSFQSFFLRLISGDLISHSFVGTKILLQCDPNNSELLKYFTAIVKAVITDRLIVTCLASRNKKEYKDPYWFRLKTETLVPAGGYIGQDFIFRFEDSRPSFRKSDTLYVYLYCPNSIVSSEEIRRDNLRPLGRVVMKVET